MLKNYIRKSIDYAAGNFFNKVLLIILLPIFTHFLLPAEYAVYTNLMIFFAFANLIYLLGIHQALFSHFYDATTNQYKFSLISSIYITLATIGVILSYLIFQFRTELAILVLRSTNYAYLFSYLAIILFFNMLFSISLSLLNIMERSRQYALTSALQNTIVLLLIILFSVNKKFSINLYFIFLAIASIISAVAGMSQIINIIKKMDIPKVKRKLFSSKITLSMLKFGIVMIPGTISMLILQASDRYMLTYLSADTMHDVGIYSAGYRIGMIMHFMVTMVSLVYLPYAMKIAKEPKAQRINKDMFKYYIIFGSIFGSMIILYSQEIFRFIIDANYLTSYKIVFAGVISSFLYGIFNIINVNYYAKKKAGNITLAVLLGSILNISLNLYLIPKYGIFGAGIASIIAYFFIVIFNYSVAAYLFKIKYQFLLVFIGLLLLACAAWFNSVFLLSLRSFIIKSIIILGLLVITYFVSREDNNISNLFKLIKKGKTNDDYIS